MDVTYSDTHKYITYGTTSTSVTPTINNAGGTFSLSQNITNIAINSSTGILTFTNPINVGDYSFNILYTKNSNVTTIPYILTVEKKNITCTASNKTYNGTVTATVTLVGIINSDSVTAPTAEFSDKNIGTGKTVTITGSIGGAKSGNYNLTTTTTTANITAKNLTAIFTCAGKVYDRTNTVSNLVFVSLSGIIGSETVSLNDGYSSTYNNVNVGTRYLTVTGLTLSGTDAGNYTVSQNSVTGVISKLDITATSNNKVYDGTRNATLTLVGVISGDTVTQSTALFDTKNIGTEKTITISGSLGGAQGGNYNLTTTTLTADITVLNITAVGDNKEYDGTAVATVSLVGVPSGENLIAPTATFNDEIIENNKTVTITGTLSGTDSGNYNLTTTTTTANITTKTLIAQFTCDGKIYDGNRTVSNLVYTHLVGIVGSEDVSLDNTYTYLYNSKNVGTVPITILGLTLSGNDASHYTVVQMNVTGVISKLDITATSNNKSYDGTRNATLTLVGVLAGDTVTQPTALFDTKNIGTNKTITISGSLGGAQGGNYNLTTTTLTADITILDITATVNDKQYDKTTTATLTLVGVPAGQNLIVPTATFDNYSVGNGKTVTVTGTLGGTDSGNFNLTTTTTTGNITKKNITCTGVNKTYDATITATVTLVGIISGESVTAPTAEFANKNIGTGKTVTITGTISGTDSGNYNLTTTTTTANITAKNLTAIFTCAGKVYDRTNTVSNLVFSSLSGIIGDDTVTLDNSYSSTYNNVNVGTRNITVTGLTLSGTDSGNYTVSQNSVTGVISKLDITATSNNKVYDGTRNATLTLVGVISGDTVTQSTALFDTKNIGTNKTITISGSLGGAQGENYNLTTTTLTANVTILNITATANDKQYDRTNVATVSLVGVIGGDSVASPSAVFDTASIGTNKTVTITGTISGTDSENYNLTTTTLTASITKRWVSLTFNAPSKQYDGTTTVELSLVSIDNVLPGDKVYLSSFTSRFNNASVGTNKLVLIENIVITGEDMSTYIGITSMTMSNGTIYLISRNMFINSALYMDQGTNVYSKYIDESNLVYDYVLTINVANLPNVNGNITNIFKTSTFTQNTQNIDAFNTNINVLSSNNLLNFSFNWTDINQRESVSINAGQSNIAFGTFSNSPSKIGDRMLEMVAHKLFGHAQARAAINNDTDFYSHDNAIWDHLSSSMGNNQIQNDIMKQYIGMGRIIQNTNNSNILIGGDVLANQPFNFNGLTFDFMLYLSGSIVLDNSLTNAERNILQNGPSVGGSSLLNGNYNIPILLKFTA